MAKPRPSKLFFLKNEAALSDPTIAALCDRFETAVVDASLRDLCAQLATLKSPTATTVLGGTDKSQLSFAQVIQKHSGIVSLLPTDVGSSPVTGIDLPALLDGLFRPAAQNRQPFQENLDIRRAVTDDVVTSIASLQNIATTGGPRILLIRGEAGVGKTTLLKRVAVEVARTGVLTLWCGRASGGVGCEHSKLSKRT